MRRLFLLLMLAGSPVFANEETPITFNGIVQDDITLYHGCGAACHSRHFQLTDPVIEDGWKKIKVMSAYYHWHGKRFVPGGVRGAGDKEPDNASIFWIFANCKSKKLGYGKTSNLSDMNEPQDVYYGPERGKLEGKPQVASMNHAPHTKWAPLCIGNIYPDEEMGHENKEVLLAHYKDVMKKQAEELRSKAIRLVIDKYDKQLKKILEGTGVNPAYMAWVKDDCKVTIKAGTHQPSTFSALEWFDVNVCTEKVEKICLLRSGCK